MSALAGMTRELDALIFPVDRLPISPYRRVTMQSIILTVATIKVTVVGGALGRCAW